MTERPTRFDKDPPVSSTPAPQLPPMTGAQAPTRVRLPADLGRELAQLAELSYPYEACGLLLGQAVGELVAVERVLHARNLDFGRLRNHYLLDPDDFLAADRVARAAGLEIVGIWHTHPDAPPRPSATDLETAWEGYSYLIVGVAALGTTELRAWRLEDGRFVELNLVD